MDFIDTLQQIPIWVEAALAVLPYLGTAVTIGVTVWGVYMTYNIWKEWR